MKEILTALMIWLGANTPFDTNHDIPNVLFLSQTQMEQMFYKGESKMPNTLHGLYDTESDTIILPDTWDRRKAWDMGVLLHEMVHYLQDHERTWISTARPRWKKKHGPYNSDT